MRFKPWLMKVTSLACANSLFVASFFAATAPAGAGVQVPPGTRVVLTTATALDPANVHVGDMVTFNVAQNVVVNGHTIIKAGATAQGEVTAAKKRNFIGIPAK